MAADVAPPARALLKEAPVGCSRLSSRRPLALKRLQIVLVQ